MLNIICSMLAGLGLFFVGLSILTEHMKQLSGRKLREKIALWTKNRYIATLWGGIMIMVTQSGSATTFVIISMLRTGLIPIAQALPVIIGMNIFGGFIVFLLISNIKIWVLAVLGISGLLFTSGKGQKLRTVSGALFGIALLYLGLSIMQESVAPLTKMHWFKDVISWTQGSYFLGFVIGAALSFLVQSSVAVVVTVVAFHLAGVFTLDQAVIMVYGANVGSSLLTFALSSGLKGTSKQLAMYQAFYNIFAAGIMIPVSCIEIAGGFPILKSFSSSLFDTPGNQLAAINILYNTIPGLILFMFVTPSVRILNRLWAETPEEQASKPRYLYDRAAEDPETAVQLIEKEQIRLVGLLKEMFSTIRTDGGSAKTAGLAEAFRTLGGIIKEAVSDISVRHKLTTDVYDRLNILVTLQHILDDSAGIIAELKKEIEPLKAFDTGRRFADSAVEGVDAVVLTLLDVVEGRNSEDAGFLQIMTSEGGHGIAGVRSAYLSGESGLDAKERMMLFSVSNLCERLILNLGKIGRGYMDFSAD